MDLKKELIIRGLKIMDIGYITGIYFLLGIFCAKLFDTIYGKFDEKKEERKSDFRQAFEIVGLIWVVGVVIYIVKNIVELIPSPLDGLYGFSHMRVKELKSASVFTFIFLLFQAHLREKTEFYYNKLSLFRG